MHQRLSRNYLKSYQQKMETLQGILIKIIFKTAFVTKLHYRLEVQAVGKPKPTIKWLKHGEEIIPSNEFVIENFEDGTSVLTISEIYPDDTGEITFEAHNSLGVAVTVTELTVEEGKDFELKLNTR